MITKTIALATAIALGAGCASADTRLADKSDFRSKQVDAISVQSKADILSAQAASAERIAMWQALSKAAEQHKEAATHLAIVAAVASSNAPASSIDRSDTVTLQQERDVQAIDYLKVLAPGLIGGVTQAGIAAISADVSKRRSDNATSVAIAEIGVDNAIVGAINNAIDELGEEPSVVEDSSGEVAGPDPDANTSGDVFDGSDDDSSDDTTETVDDGLGDDSLDDDTADDTSDDTTDDGSEAVDCSGTQFSPINPACQ